jgi:hypothetical protein
MSCFCLVPIMILSLPIGWDWAPAQTIFDTKGRRLGTRGIWKHVYLVAYTDDSPLITAVVPVVYHVKDALTFLVNVTVHYQLQSTKDVDMTVEMEWGAKRSMRFDCIVLETK